MFSSAWYIFVTELRVRKSVSESNEMIYSKTEIVVYFQKFCGCWQLYMTLETLLCGATFVSTKDCKKTKRSHKTYVSVAWNETNRTVSNEVCRATWISQSQLQFASGTTDFLKISVSEMLPQKEDSHKQCTLFCSVLKREWSTCLRRYFSGSE
jgi:hypothetical protein